MMKTKIFVIAALFFGIAGLCWAQNSASVTSKAGAGSNAPYNEGPVWTLTMIKTKTGLSDEYIKQITGTVKPRDPRHKNHARDYAQVITS